MSKGVRDYSKLCSKNPFPLTFPLTSSFDFADQSMNFLEILLDWNQGCSPTGTKNHNSRRAGVSPCITFKLFSWIYMDFFIDIFMDSHQLLFAGQIIQIYFAYTLFPFESWFKIHAEPLLCPLGICLPPNKIASSLGKLLIHNRSPFSYCLRRSDRLIASFAPPRELAR